MGDYHSTPLIISPRHFHAIILPGITKITRSLFKVVWDLFQYMASLDHSELISGKVARSTLLFQASRSMWHNVEITYLLRMCIKVDGSQILWRIKIITWWPRQTGRHFTDDVVRWVFCDVKIWISIEFYSNLFQGSSLQYSALVQKMACRRLGDKPPSEPKWFNARLSDLMRAFLQMFYLWIPCFEGKCVAQR